MGSVSLEPIDLGEVPYEVAQADMARLEDNLGALQVDLTFSQLARLDEVSAIDLGNPHDLLASDHIRTVTTGDMKIETLG